MPNSWENRTKRLTQEESASQIVQAQLIDLISASIGSHMFNRLTTHDRSRSHVEPWNRKDILCNGKYACVNYVSQVLRLLDEGLWTGPPGTWMKYLPRDLGLAGWYQIPEHNTQQGDVVLWEVFRSRQDRIEKKPGNGHVGFVWMNGNAVSVRREDPRVDDSLRSPQIHPLCFDQPKGKIDGPRKVQSFWTHDKLRVLRY